MALDIKLGLRNEILIAAVVVVTIGAIGAFLAGTIPSIPNIQNQPSKNSQGKQLYKATLTYKVTNPVIGGPHVDSASVSNFQKQGGLVVNPKGASLFSNGVEADISTSCGASRINVDNDKQQFSLSYGQTLKKQDELNSMPAGERCRYTITLKDSKGNTLNIKNGYIQVPTPS